MSTYITIDAKTSQFLHHYQLNQLLQVNANHQIEIKRLNKFLLDENFTHRNALSKLIIESLSNERGLLDTTKKSHRASRAILLGLSFLGLAGAICNGISGFDGIVSIIQLFTSSAFLMYVPGVFFAFLSIFLFISFDFSQGANALGVQLFNDDSAFKFLIQQEKQLKNIIRSLEDDLLNVTCKNDAQKSLYFIQLLKSLHQSIQQQKKAFKDNIKPSLIKTCVEKTGTFLCALLFLFYGYFAGQSGAMFILGASSIAVGMSTPLGAVLMVSLGIIAAIGAVSFYLLVQKKGVEELISNMLGNDKETYDRLNKPNRVEKIEKELENKTQLFEKAKATFFVRPKVKATNVGEKINHSLTS